MQINSVRFVSIYDCLDLDGPEGWEELPWTELVVLQRMNFASDLGAYPHLIGHGLTSLSDILKQHNADWNSLEKEHWLDDAHIPEDGGWHPDTLAYVNAQGDCYALDADTNAVLFEEHC